MAEGLCHKDRKNKANKVNNHKETRSKEQSLKGPVPGQAVTLSPRKGFGMPSGRQVVFWNLFKVLVLFPGS
jgi:acetyl/propionyl-CoA carboxylase alpha subunit